MKSIEQKRKDLQAIRNRLSSESDIDVRNRTYWYIWGIHQGQRLALGPYSSESDAWNMVYQKNVQSPDVIALRTRNLAAATSMLKARTLQGESTLDEALQKARHQID